MKSNPVEYRFPFNGGYIEVNYLEFVDKMDGDSPSLYSHTSASNLKHQLTQRGVAYRIIENKPEPDIDTPTNPKAYSENHSAQAIGPEYYKSLSVEPWTAMEGWLTREEFIGFLRGNIIKYHARAHTKKEQFSVMMQKAHHYSLKLQEVLNVPVK